MRHMKYLVLEAEDEIFYDLAEIHGISCDLAVNVLDESELNKKNLKPLETVIVILFEDGNTEAFSVVGLRMHFD